MSRHNACGLAAAALLASLCGAQTPVPPPAAPQAQGGEAAAAKSDLAPHLLIQSAPGVAECAAPEWIVPGTRITYFSSVAEIQDAAGAVGLTPDPNGNITDSKGNRFREGNPVGLGTAGAGWDLCDIVAVEPGVIVLAMRAYQNSKGLQGPCTPNGTRAWLVHPTGCDFFLHPRLLQQLPESSANGVSLLRASIVHRGTKYDAVRSTVEIPGSRQSSVYDLASGVQLTHNSASTSAGGTVFRADGNNYQPEQKQTRVLANNQLHGTRQLDLPWKDAPVPQWAKKMKRARYQGARVDSGTPEMGLGRLYVSIEVELTPTRAGETFVAFDMKLTQQIQGMPPMEPVTIATASGPGSIDPLWIAPEVLNRLRAGQGIDRDASTGIETGVAFVGPGRDGRPIAVIGLKSPGFETTWTYLQSDGRLLGSQQVQRSGSTGGTVTTTIELVGIDG